MSNLIGQKTSLSIFIIIISVSKLEQVRDAILIRLINNNTIAKRKGQTTIYKTYT